MALIYGSSQKNPNYANFQGRQTYNQPPASLIGPRLPAIGTKPQAPAPIPQGGGNAPGGGGSVLGATTPPLESRPDEPQIDFEAIYAPAMQALDEAIAPLEQGFSNYQTAQTNQLATDTSMAKQSLSEQQGILGKKAEQQTRLGGDAQDQARRLHSEMAQGIQAKYGNTTNLGEFAEGQLGNATFQQIGQIRQNLSAAMGEISDKLLQVKTIHDITLKDLADKTQERIAAAKDNLDQRLSEIRQQKGALASEKAAQVVNLLNNYRQEVAAVNARNTQFQQQLFVQQQNATQSLQAALARGKAAAESFSLHNFQVGTQNPVGYRQGSRGTTTDLSGNPITIPQGATLSGVGSFDPDKLISQENLDEEL